MKISQNEIKRPVSHKSRKKDRYTDRQKASKIHSFPSKNGFQRAPTPVKLGKLYLFDQICVAIIIPLF